MPRTPRLFSILAALALAACQAAPAPQVVVPFPGMVPGKGTIALVPTVVRGGARQLLAVVAPWTETAIDHLVVKLYHPGAPTVPRETLSIGSADMYNAIVFSNLAPATTYRVTADAYTTPGESAADRISKVATSYVDVVVADDDRPAMGNLVVDLDDVTFSGEARSAGTTITPGGLLHSGTSGGDLAPRLDVNTSTTKLNLSPPASGELGDVALAPDGTLYISDPTRNVIWRKPLMGALAVFAGGLDEAPSLLDGVGTAARFNHPRALAIWPDGTLYVGEDGAVRMLNPSSQQVDTIAGAGTTGDVPSPLNAGSVAPEDARFDVVSDLWIDPDGTVVVADRNNSRIRAIQALDGRVANLSYGAALVAPNAVVRGRDGKLYVAASGRHAIYRLTPGNTLPELWVGVEDVAGALDGPIGTGQLNAPAGLAFDPAGQLVVSAGPQIRLVTTRGQLSTLAGDPAATGSVDSTLFQGGVNYGGTRYDSPGGLVLRDANQLYIVDRFARRLRTLILGV